MPATRPQGRPAVRRLRAAVQWGVFALTVWGGIDLYRFAVALEHGRDPGFAKPLSPEGFLPIGSLMSFKLWATSGFVDTVHPAGLAIFTGALVVSLLLRKGFCGWICPVGTLSDALGTAVARFAGRLPALPRRLDVPLRSLKYLLLGFFLWVIVVKMPAPAIRGWLQTDYWKTADLKMLAFFRNPSGVTLAVLGVLTVLSLATRNFWCRYLCPYGALLGLLGAGSPVKVRRDDARCVHCHRCTESCPALLPVETLGRVRSPECLGCLTCVSRCPAPGALDATLWRGRVVPPLVYALLVAGVFGAVLAVAWGSGHWEAGVTPEQYLRILPGLASVDHP